MISVYNENEIQITVSRFQQAHRCMIRAEAKVCVCLCDCCACLGIEGSKERLLGDLYHSSPSFFQLCRCSCWVRGAVGSRLTEKACTHTSISVYQFWTCVVIVVHVSYPDVQYMYMM